MDLSFRICRIIRLQMLSQAFLPFTELPLPGRTAAALIVTPRFTRRLPSFQGGHSYYLGHH
jgi:hypothetical protein